MHPPYDIQTALLQHQETSEESQGGANEQSVFQKWGSLNLQSRPKRSQ